MENWILVSDVVCYFRLKESFAKVGETAQRRQRSFCRRDFFNWIDETWIESASTQDHFTTRYAPTIGIQLNTRWLNRFDWIASGTMCLCFWLNKSLFQIGYTIRLPSNSHGHRKLAVCISSSEPTGAWITEKTIRRLKTICLFDWPFCRLDSRGFSVTSMKFKKKKYFV